MRKLYRHTHADKHVVGGVFSGLAEYLEISPGILRVFFFIMLIVTGIVPAVLLYFASMLLIKKNPDHNQPKDNVVDIN